MTTICETELERLEQRIKMYVEKTKPVKILKRVHNVVHQDDI